MCDPLPLSLLNDFLYCPRRAALEINEGVRSANEHTLRGICGPLRLLSGQKRIRESFFLN
jgi:hypothetical protein